MTNYSRRKFLKHLGAAASALLVAGRSSWQNPVLALSGSSEPFEFLVLGDSIASGQGLKEEHKFYTLVKDWLERDVFGNTRPVNLKVTAHSGTTLTLHPDEAAALAEAELDETMSYHPEVNLSFPTAKTQIDIVAKEYEAEGRATKSVDLIMLSGGINDITTRAILNPFGDDDQLRSDITKYCRDSMREVLLHAGSRFPNASIAVIGYFPLVSPKTSSGKLFNAILEIMEYPRPLKPLTNNLLTKQFFKLFHKKAARRSRIWLEESNLRFQEAVNAFNAKSDQPQAVFIKSPITEDNCFGTKNSLVFGMSKKGLAADLAYNQRSIECRKALPALKAIRGLNFSVHLCELSGLAHPNIQGAKAYAEAIKTGLRQVSKVSPF